MPRICVEMACNALGTLPNLQHVAYHAMDATPEGKDNAKHEACPAKTNTKRKPAP